MSTTKGKGSSGQAKCFDMLDETFPHKPSPPPPPPPFAPHFQEASCFGFATFLKRSPYPLLGVWVWVGPAFHIFADATPSSPPYPTTTTMRSRPPLFFNDQIIIPCREMTSIHLWNFRMFKILSLLLYVWKNILCPSIPFSQHFSKILNDYRKLKKNKKDPISSFS